jgi:tryptophanyl-tRNA synthetase
MQKKKMLTGIQASGILHIGNFFGALKPFMELYPQYESTLMVADLHSLTSLKDAQTLRQNTINVVKDYLAVGVGPQEVTLFKQSDNPHHTELAWILNCQVTVPFLMQAHSYKDKVTKGLEPNAGLFTYPMLMAADILLYDTDVVPVGEDQRQHVEYAREAANKFNLAYGEGILKEPKEAILKSVGVVPGTDGQKMSKSYKNTIPLFGTKDEIAKAVMSIVTDSGSEVPQNVYAIHRLLKSEEELTPLYEEHKGKYKNLKEALIEDLESFIAPMRERRDAITEADVEVVLKEGAQKAIAASHMTIEKVRKAVGIAL